MSFYVSTATFFLLHCDEWDRVVALPRHKFVTGATLLQLLKTESKNKARHKYNFSFKLKVIKFAEEKEKHAAAKFFNVDRKRVCLPGQLLLISDV